VRNICRKVFFWAVICVALLTGLFFALTRVDFYMSEKDVQFLRNASLIEEYRFPTKVRYSDVPSMNSLNFVKTEKPEALMSFIGKGRVDVFRQFFYMPSYLPSVSVLYRINGAYVVAIDDVEKIAVTNVDGRNSKFIAYFLLF